MAFIVAAAEWRCACVCVCVLRRHSVVLYHNICECECVCLRATESGRDRAQSNMKHIYQSTFFVWHRHYEIWIRPEFGDPNVDDIFQFIVE